MAELVSVRVRGCECPGTPHEEGDVVYMRPTISLDGGLAAEHDSAQALAEAIAEGVAVAGGIVPKEGWTEDQKTAMARDMGERLRRKWLATYVRYGAVGWNLVDEQGPVRFDVQAVLDDYALAQPVAEKGDELYGETVNRPLVARQATRSQRGRKVVSISRTKASTPKPRRPSSPATSAGSGRKSA